MTKSSSRIPEFKSLQEEAEFWDTHDLTDFEDELRPVEVNVTMQRKQGITVKFDPATLQQIRRTAKSRGLGATTLIRMWVMEKLDAKGKSY